MIIIGLAGDLSGPLVVAGIGVGICSSVAPYVADPLAMSRLLRTGFALYLAILPATATHIAAIVLAQIPTLRDTVGIAFVMIAIAIHKLPASTAWAMRWTVMVRQCGPVRKRATQQGDGGRSADASGLPAANSGVA